MNDDTELLKKEIENNQKISDLRWKQHDEGAKEFRSFVVDQLKELSAEFKEMRIDVTLEVKNMREKFNQMDLQILKVTLITTACWTALAWLVQKYLK